MYEINPCACVWSDFGEFQKQNNLATHFWVARLFLLEYFQCRESFFEGVAFQVKFLQTERWATATLSQGDTVKCKY